MTLSFDISNGITTSNTGLSRILSTLMIASTCRAVRAGMTWSIVHINLFHSHEIIPIPTHSHDSTSFQISFPITFIGLFPVLPRPTALSQHTPRRWSVAVSTMRRQSARITTNSVYLRNG